MSACGNVIGLDREIEQVIETPLCTNCPSAVAFTWGSAPKTGQKAGYCRRCRNRCRNPLPSTQRHETRPAVTDRVGQSYGTKVTAPVTAPYGSSVFLQVKATAVVTAPRLFLLPGPIYASQRGARQRPRSVGIRGEAGARHVCMMRVHTRGSSNVQPVSVPGDLDLLVIQLGEVRRGRFREPMSAWRGRAMRNRP